MLDGLTILISVMSVLDFVLNTTVIIALCCGAVLPSLPTHFHKDWKLTWFGAIIVFILMVILFSPVYILGLLKFAFFGKWFEYIYD